MGKWAAQRRLKWTQQETRGLLTTKVSSTVASFSATLVGCRIVVTGPVRPYATRKTCSVFWLDLRDMKWRWKDIPRGPMLCQHSAVLLQDTLLTYGGLYPDTFTQVWAFDLCLLEFRKVDTYGMKPKPRRLHCAGFMHRRKEMVVFGGKTMLHSPLNDLCVLDCVDFTWAYPKVSGRLPQKRFDHASCMAGTNMFIYGGCNGKYTLADLHVIRCERGFFHWSSPRLSGVKPWNGRGATLLFVDGRLLLYGGRSRSMHSGVAVLNLRKKRWRGDKGEHRGDFVVSGERVENAHHCAVMVDDDMVVLGGTGMDFGQCCLLSPDTDSIELML